MNIFLKIKSSKFVNTGIAKKIKDFIYFKLISPSGEKKTDKYRKEIIDKFAIICNKCNWQLLSGSLLKYYRDGTMEGQDLDLYVLESDFEKIKDRFFEFGFKLKQVFLNNEGKITEYKFLYKGVEVDIFLVLEDKNNYIACFTLEKPNAKNIEKKVVGNMQIISGKDYCTYGRFMNEFKNAKSYKYKDIKFRGPKNIEKMLCDQYGAEWKVPNADYDPRISNKENMPVFMENAKGILFIKTLNYYPDNF